MIRAIIVNSLAGAVIVLVAALVLAGPALAANCGKASFYCCEHHGRLTASGERFDQNAMTAAMPARKHLGQRYRVTAGGKSVVVRITDTGGFAKYGRIIDLSRGSFERLAPTSKGVIRVCLERL
jgi:rare lipoprotein A